PRRLNPALPAALETIVLKAMAKDPAGRYGSARELAEDLRCFLENRPVRARRPTTLGWAARWAQRHPTLVAALAVLLVLAVAGLAVSNALIARERDIARRRTREAVVERGRAEASRQDADRQRLRAEGNYHQAKQAVDEFYTRVSQSELLNREGMQPLR